MKLLSVLSALIFILATLNTGYAQSSTQNLTIDPRTNRITNPGYAYDAVGNLIAAPGATYTYDAENRLTSATVNGVTTNYFYDGLGRRIKKVTNNITTLFVYNSQGKLIAEYEGNPVPSSPTKEYVYGPTGLLTIIEPNNPEPNQTTKYLTNDHLGTPRIVTDAQGNTLSFHDYYPFGQEIDPNIGGRNNIPGFSTLDNIRQKFTGYERDSETGLDFAQGRYYSSAAGRFISPDIVRGDRANPQSWNKYPYVLNNPLRFVDPDGQAPQEGADRLQRQDIKDLMSGKITKEEYLARQSARGVGAVVGGITGAAALVFGPKAITLGTTVLGIILRNPQTIQQIGNDLVDMSTGNPAPISKPNPEELGEAIGTALRKLETGKTAAIAEQVTATGLTQAEAVTATEAALQKGLGLRSFRSAQSNGDVVISSVMPGTDKPIFIVNAIGQVVRGTATIEVKIVNKLPEVVVKDVKPLLK